ncbi:hypothetical protein EVAR_30800_1 [Eumeta japonica]|uniref:Uncharacterized protein n=1 Tax=Eumeta variegata TaxID=151549 RepID=A0A4C1V734_EUMVA|nr:hypothetical protein EVAR_30800_1 [Eumeta japonica]
MRTKKRAQDYVCNARIKICQIINPRRDIDRDSLRRRSKQFAELIDVGDRYKRRMRNRRGRAANKNTGASSSARVSYWTLRARSAATARFRLAYIYLYIDIIRYSDLVSPKSSTSGDPVAQPNDSPIETVFGRRWLQ